MTQKKIESFAVSAASARLQGLASKDSFRPNMAGVHFDGKRKLAIATNGHALAIDYIGDVPAPLGRTVKFGTLKKLKPHEPKAYRFTVTESTQEGECCVETSGKGAAHLIDEGFEFPDWEGVIPEPVTSFVVALDAALLAQLADAVCESSDRYVTLQFDVTRPEAGVVVAPHRGTGCGVLMPCKREPNEEDPLPRLKKLIGK